MKSENFCISSGLIVPCFPTRPSKATMKLRNEKSSLQGAPVGSVHGSVAEEAVDAIAAPVQRAVGRHAAQRLRRHRALHRMEGRRSRQERDRLRLRCSADRGVGVAEVPGQAVEVAEDVAARAGGLAVARRGVAS